MAFALLLLLASHAIAEDDVELSGILINETRTHAGHDFYAAFSSVWANVDPSGQYTLAVVERPSIITASQITIKFAGRPVFQRFISTKPDENRKVAQQAAQVIARTLGTMRTDVQGVMDALFPDPDMAPDEIKLY